MVWPVTCAVLSSGSASGVSCRALALNCSAPINDKQGAEAKDWRAGKPVRVVRSVKGGKHSKYAPLEGNRYDGIYKVRGLRCCLGCHSCWGCPGGSGTVPWPCCGCCRW